MCTEQIGAISRTSIPPTPIPPTYYRSVPFRLKCGQNNVKQLKQAVQVYKVKGIVQRVNKSNFKWQYEHKFL